MEVRYADEALSHLCVSDRELHKEYGADCARKIRIRLKGLASAETIDDHVAALVIEIVNYHDG